MPAPIGIANLPNQKHRRAARKGCHLTLLLVGASGLGKTTFVNTLFTTQLLSTRDYASRYETSDVRKIKITEADLEERNFRLRLSLVDTPGFADGVNNAESWTPIVDYVEAQYDEFLDHEMRPDRSNIEDNRVHACLYFIEPTGHGLKLLDVRTMKELGERLNLIPVIAKADTMTPEEIVIMKKRVREQIERHEIKVYTPPVESDDEETEARNREIAEAMPFTIIGSDENVVVNGQPVRGRAYPWGVVEVENDLHSDFRKLRSLLVRTHLLDLITTTESVHYEAYRDKKLEAGGLSAGMTPEKLQRELEAQMKRQEAQMRAKFTEKVREEEERFRKWEERLNQEEEQFQKEKEARNKELEELREQIERLAAAARAGQKKK